jgi:hypothetical protein
MSERLIDRAAWLLDRARGEPQAFVMSRAMIDRLKTECWDQHLSLRHPENHKPPPLEPVTHLFGVPVREQIAAPDDYFSLLVRI